ncbi:MarR family winged helix-turn-helix transcriptional regulator [Pleionea sediminis]|uniref:MarR family winged helix-turn-helix transcriptional regulator n=1 Tax=Pleionea sediminis TaxID=2569479 RepID=UPI00118581D7|nr:MarR family transcriptional regulator [Pleionea sediminis]
MENYEELLISLRKIIRSIDLHSKDLNKSAGMTGPQLVVLQVICKNEGTTAKALAEKVNLSQGTITTILDRLEGRTLIQRVRSETDRRSVRLNLTEQGKSLLLKAPKPLQAHFIERFKKLPNDRQEVLLDAFAQVATMMDASELDAAPMLEIGQIDKK